MYDRPVFVCICHIVISKIFYHKLQESPPLSLLNTESKSPAQLTLFTLYNIIRIRIRIQIHITPLSIQRRLLYFVFFLLFYLLWFSAARIKCFCFPFSVCHIQKQYYATMLLCVFIRCVTSMKSVWSFTFHNDSVVYS